MAARAAAPKRHFRHCPGGVAVEQESGARIMADTDQGVSSGSGRRGQARALAVQALDAERRGDQEQADRLFTEADRIDPEAVADVLQEDEAATRQPGPTST